MTDIPKELADTLDRVQEDFESRVEQAHNRSKELDSEQSRRKTIARILKILTGVAGIAIAAGFLDKIEVQGQTGSQILGAAVLIIVLVEGVYANFKRLVAVTSARDALERESRQAESTFQENYTDFLKIRDSKPKESAEGLIALNKRLTKLLRDTIDKVESALRVADAASINGLNLDDSKEPE